MCYTGELNEDLRRACSDADDYEYEGKGYCILHLPCEGKKDKRLFNRALRNKLEQGDFNFRGTFFPSDTSLFEDFKFNAVVDFTKATFCGNIDFSGAEFHEETSFENARFCDATVDFSRAKFNGKLTNFQYAKFSSLATFHEAEFNGKETYFSAAVFGGPANFRGRTYFSSFSKAKFRGQTYFTDAKFRGRTSFFEATFRGEANFGRTFFSEEANFESVTFRKGADFTKATFREVAGFLGATFGGGAYYFDAAFCGLANFTRATFSERVHFSRLEPSAEMTLGFRNVNMEKPERVHFHTEYLRPSWFVDVDAQEFDFSEVEWFRPHDRDKPTLKDEIEALRRRDVEPPKILPKLTKACRRLMNNAEENRDYPTANEFHYWSMDARRLGSWSVLYQALLKKEVRQGIEKGERQYITRVRDLRFGDLDAKSLLSRETWKRIRNRERFGLINGLYWALSGYGVKPLRAFVVLIIMSLVFALLYSWPVIGAAYSLQAFAGSDSGLLNYFLTTEMYSLGTLARLNPEPKPTTPGLFQTLVIIAGILGPLQIALFLLAVRRKVMR